mgnify:FL=1
MNPPAGTQRSRKLDTPQFTATMPGPADPPTVDQRLPTPLYHQVYVDLRNKIISGAYPLDTLLPSEQRIAAEFQVSRITAKRALNELEASDLVVRERGRGTRVVYQIPAPMVRTRVEGLLENLLAMGLETRVSLLAFDYLPPTPEVARAMDCDPATPVQRAVRVRMLETEPFSHLTTHVPADIGRCYTENELASQPLLTLLDRSGVRVDHAEQTIGATLADSIVAGPLGVELGSPLLRIERVVYERTQRPVEHITALYRPDRYQYHMTLTRVGNARARSWTSSSHPNSTDSPSSSPNQEETP